MISIDNDIANEIVRMLNNYTKELDVALDKWCDDHHEMKWIEGEIANSDAISEYLRRKLEIPV